MRIFFGIFILLGKLWGDTLHFDAGWSLLGGPLAVPQDDRFEFWVYRDGQWASQPKVIRSHEGFWLKSPQKGKLIAHKHDFFKTLLGVYDLYELLMNFPTLERQITYEKNRLGNSHLVINNNLSFTETVILDVNATQKDDLSTKGNFVPLINDTGLIVAKQNDGNHLLEIALQSNILTLIRRSTHPSLGKISYKYTYIRQ